MLPINNLVASVEGVVGHWVEQIHAFAFQLTQDISNPDQGLLHHLRELHSREHRLQLLLEEVNAPRVRTSLEFLGHHRSPLPLLCEEATTVIQDAWRQISSQARLLSCLERPLLALYSPSLSLPLEPMYELLASLHIVYLQGDDRLKREFAGLAVRASWDVARSSQRHVQLHRYSAHRHSYQEESESGGNEAGVGIDSWESPVDVAMMCCKDWITCYTQIHKHFESQAYGTASSMTNVKSTAPSTSGSVVSSSIAAAQDNKQNLSTVSNKAFAVPVSVSSVRNVSSWLPLPSVALLPVQLLATRCEDLRYISTSVAQLSGKFSRVPVAKSAGAAIPDNFKPSGHLSGTVQVPDRHPAEENATDKTLKDGMASKPQVLSTSQPVDETDSDPLEKEVSQVNDVLQMALAIIAKKEKFAFVLTSKEWIKYFDRFRERVEEVERRYQCLMIASLQEVQEASQGLAILNRFRPMAARKTLFPVFFIMIDRILDLLERDMGEAERHYVFRAIEVGKPGFSYCQMAKWCLSTRLTLHGQVELVRQQRWVPYSPRLDASYSRWTRTASLLSEGAVAVHEAWSASLETRPTKRLAQPVMAWLVADNKHLLQENFDRQLAINLEEAEAFSHLNMALPESLAVIARDVLAIRSARKQVSTVVDEFNTLARRLSPDEARLFEGPLQTLVATFLPCVSSVTWSSRQRLSSVLSSCSSAVRQLSLRVDEYTDFNRHLYEELDKIKSYLLYDKKEEKLHTGDEFLKDILKQRTAVITEVRNQCGQLENDLYALYENVINQDATALSSEMWVAYVQRVDSLYLQAQQQVMINSMLFMEKILISSRSIPDHQIVPLFLVNVTLSNNKIISDPMIDGLWQTVTHLKEVLLDGFVKLPCLIRRYDLNKARAHDHQAIINDKLVDSCQERINDHYALKVNTILEDLIIWQKYREIWEIDRTEFSNRYTMCILSPDEIRSDVDEFRNKISEIEVTECFQNMGTFRINYSKLKGTLISHCKKLMQELLQSLYQSNEDRLARLSKEGEAVQQLASLHPSSVSELLSALKSCDEIRSSITEREGLIEIIENNFDLLREFGFVIPNQTVLKMSELSENRCNMIALVEEKILEVKTTLDVFKKTKTTESEELKLKIREASDKISTGLPVSLATNYEDSLRIINECIGTISNIKQSMKINDELEILSLPPVKFYEMNKLLKDLSKASDIWGFLEKWKEEWNRWEKFSVWEVSVIAFMEILSAFETSIANHSDDKVNEKSASIQSQEPLWEIHEELIASISSARKLVPLLSSLQDAPLQLHHWAEIKTIVAADFDEKSHSFTIGFLRELNLASYIDEITSIVERSLKEAVILQDIARIKSSASKITLNIQDVPVIGVFVVQSIAEASSAVADLIVQLRTCRRNTHAELYMEQFLTLEVEFNRILDFLEEISRIQKMWNKWAPFFQSQDVRCHLLQGTSLFESCNDGWKQISKMMSSKQFVYKIISIDGIQRLVQDVKSSFDRMPTVIEEYIEDIRDFFPRFNLLSDDDLVAITSQVNDATNLKPFFYKLFGSVCQLKVQRNVVSGGVEVVGVISPEGELVELASTICIVGPVTSWLSRLGVSLAHTLRESVKQCRANIRSVGPKFEEILKNYPLQVCSLTLQLTVSSEIAKSKTKAQGGQEIFSNQDKYLKDITLRLNRILNSAAQKLLREKVRLIFVTVLFLRDQLQKIRDDKGDKEQLDSYLGLVYVANKDTGQMNVQFGPSLTLPYGWEYQGMRPTPHLTETGGRSLMDFLKIVDQDLIPGVVGRNSTGKTETVKLASTLLGRHFVVIECNPFITTKYLSRILFGCLQLPSLLLFENVQVLQPNLVPVFVALLKEICKLKKTRPVSGLSKQQQQQKLHPAMFQGIPMVLHPFSNIALEMIGVGEESRFVLETGRSVCQPVPFLSFSWKGILEADLTSRGYKEGKLLSTVLEEFLDILRTTLPTKPNYQFGLSFAKSAVSEATDTIRSYSEVSEMNAVVEALRGQTIKQIDEEDVPLFEEIFKTMYPEHKNDWKTSTDKKSLKEYLTEKNWEYNERYLNNLITLRETIARSTLIALVGAEGCGKSEAIGIIKAQSESSGNKSIAIHRIDPQLIGNEALYGSLQSTFSIGITEAFLNKLLTHTSISHDKETWIVLQSNSLTLEWAVQFLQRVCVDENVIHCFSPQKVRVPSHVKIILEISGSLESMNARDLQKCSCVSLNHDINFGLCHIAKWLKGLERTHRKLLSRLIEKYLIPLIADLLTNRVAIIMKARVFTVLFSTLSDLHKKGLKKEVTKEQIKYLFFISVAWSFGSSKDEVTVNQMEDLEFSLLGKFNKTRVEQQFSLTFPDRFLEKFCIITDELNIVPTENLLSMVFICKILRDNSIPIMLIGEQGSGTSTVLQVLRKIDEPDVKNIDLNFNCSTTPSQMITAMKANLVRIGEHHYEGEMQHCVYYVDHLHCADNEEALACFLNLIATSNNFQIVFNNDTRDFDKIPPNTFVLLYQANKLTTAFESVSENQYKWCNGKVHFIEVCMMNKAEHKEIFLELFVRNFKCVDLSVKSLKNAVADCYCEVYNALVKTCQVAESKETMFLRQITIHPRQMKALFNAISLSQHELLDKETFINLFVHECLRIFGDPEVLPRQQLMVLLQDKVKKYFSTDISRLCIDHTELVYFMKEGSYTEMKVADVFEEIRSSQTKVLGEKSSLVTFKSLGHHVARITRGLSIRNSLETSNSRLSRIGHVGLIGPHGVGKRTATLISVAFLNGKVLSVFSDEQEKDVRNLLEKQSSSSNALVLFIDWKLIENPKSLAFLNIFFYENFLNINSINVSIVLSVVSVSELKEAYMVMPCIFENISVNVFEKWSEDELCSIAGQLMFDCDNSSHNDEEKERIINVLTKVHTESCRLSAERGLSKSIPSVHFLHFCNCVVDQRSAIINKRRTEKKTLEICTQKFEEGKMKVTELSSQLQEQRVLVTHIQQTCGNTILKLKNIKSEQGRLEQELTKKNNLLERQKEESSRIRELINHDLADPKLQLKNVHKSLNRITVEQFDKIRTLLRPPPFVERIFELTLTVIGLEPSWNEAKKQMVNSIDFVTRIRSTSAETIDENVLFRLQTNLAKETCSVEDIRESYPTPSTFLSWLIKFENYARVYKDYHPLQLQADAIEKDVQETHEALRSHQHDLANFSVQQQVLESQLKEREEQLEKAEVFMKTLESRIQVAQKVVKQLLITRGQWDEQVLCIDSDLSTADGDSILAAAYIIYFGNLEFEDRRNLEQVLKQCMIDNVVSFNDQVEVSSMISPLHKKVTWINQGLNLDIFTQENVGLAMSSDLVMVVFDPNCVMIDWLHKFSEAILLNFEDENWELKFFKAIGNECFLYVEQLRPQIPLSLARFLKEAKSILRFKDVLSNTEYAFADRLPFKLLVVVKKPPVNDCLEYNIVVNNGSQLVGLQRVLSVKLCMGQKPETVERLIKNTSELVEKRNSLLHDNTQVECLMNQFEAAILEESSVMENLENASVRVIDIKKKCSELESSIETAYASIATYDQTSLPLANLFLLLEKLPSWEHNLSLSFQNFVHLVVECIPKVSGQLRWGSLLDQNTLLATLASVNRYLQAQLGGPPETAIGLVFTLWYHIHLGRTSYQQMEAFAKDIRSSSRTDQVSQVPWLDDHRWNELLELESIKSFKKLSQSISDNSESWLQWCSSEYVETCPLPRPYERKLIGFSRLLLISKLRPDRLLEAAESYYLKLFKSTERASAESVSNIVHNSHPSKPIVLEISPTVQSESFLSHLQILCYPLVEPDTKSLQFVTAGEEQEVFLSELIKTALRNGYWLVLPCNRWDKKQYAIVHWLIKGIKPFECHKRFRIWFILQNDKASSLDFQQDMLRINVSEPTAIRETIEKYFKLLGDNALALYSSESSKWLLVSLTLFHISVEARQEIEEGTFIQTVSDEDWFQAENKIREVVTSTAGSHFADFHNLITLLSSVYSPKSSTSQAQAAALETMRCFLDGEVSQNITARVPALTHYSVPVNNSFEDHKTHLEFIYKATNLSLSYTSATAGIRKQIQRGRGLKKAIQIMYAINTIHEIDYSVWVKDLIYLISNLYISMPHKTGSFFVILKNEIDRYTSDSQRLVRIFTSSVPNEEKGAWFISDCLHRFTSLYSLSLHSIEEDETEYFNLFSLRGKYLLDIAKLNKIPSKIVLNHFMNAESLWSSMIRNLFADWPLWPRVMAFSELTYVPHNQRTKSGTSQWCLYLESVTAVGATWDSVGERLNSTDKPALNIRSKTFTLAVAPLASSNGGTIQQEPVRRCRIPVYRVDDLSMEPVFHVSLPCSLPRNYCLLQCTRIVLG